MAQISHIDVKLGAPGFPHLQGLDFMTKGHQLADLRCMYCYIGRGFWRN